jgi:hypothetical protein
MKYISLFSLACPNNLEVVTLDGYVFAWNFDGGGCTNVLETSEIIHCTNALQ